MRRLGEAAAVALLGATAALLVLAALPGEPRELYQNPRLVPAQQAQLGHALGLDRSLTARYGAWLGRVARGDLGVSLTFSRPVVEVLADHLEASALLACGALLFALTLGLPVGIAAALTAGSRLDAALRLLCLAVYSVPQFWLGVVAISFFSFRLDLVPPGHLLPAGGRDAASTTLLVDLGRHLLLPSTVLGAGMAGGLARFLRNSLLDVLGRDYIRTAHAAGIAPFRIVWKHALRLALAPVFHLLGAWLPGLASGLLVTEVVFAWPGLGRLTYEAILRRDYPLVVGATALATLLVTAGALAADLLHTAADPRLGARADT
jgi:peptide/nickel transport system permease protein